jgi:glycosyltransferase involved in cell wall biosynthesis
MHERSSTHDLSVTFVSATRDSPGARTPQGGQRLFPGQSFDAALERNGLRTTSLSLTTKMVSMPLLRTRGYRGTRGVPLSPRFLIDLVRSPTPFFVCREYGVETLLTLIVARLRRGHAVVFQEHVGRAGARLSFVDTQYRRAIGRLATAFVANTPAAKDEIIRLLRVDPGRVFQIMTLVPPDRAELCLERPDIGSPRARPLFLFIGQLIPRKNVDVILRAATLLKKQGYVFEVWIGGEGPDEERLRRIAVESDLDELVYFIGPIPYTSVGFVYDECDVFVMPSHADLLSVAVLEATRFGKAVICSARVGSAGVVAHDQINALIFDPAQPSQLADCMRRFIVEPHLAAEMGARSEAIMDEHTPDAAAVALIDALKHVASVKK